MKNWLAAHPFPDFKGGGFLALRRKGVITSVAAVPAKFLRGLDGQVERIVIGAIHQKYLSAKNQ